MRAPSHHCSRRPEPDLEQDRRRPPSEIRLGRLAHHENSADGHQPCGDLGRDRRAGEAPGGDNLEGLPVALISPERLGAASDDIYTVPDADSLGRLAEEGAPPLAT